MPRPKLLQSFLIGGQRGWRAALHLLDWRSALIGLVLIALSVWGVRFWNPVETVRLTGKDQLAAGEAGLNGLTWSPDQAGSRLATVSATGKILMWDWPSRTPIPIAIGSRQPLTTLAFSGVDWLLAGGEEKYVLVWGLKSQKGKLLPQFDAPVTSVQVQPRSETVIVGLSNGVLHIVSPATAEITPLPSGHTGGVKAIAFSPDGNVFVTAGTDGQLIWRDSDSHKQIRSIAAHDNEVSDLAFTPDGRKLVSCSWDNFAKIWDGNTGKAILSLEHPESVSCVGVAGEVVVTGAWDGGLRFWSLSSGTLLVTEPTGEAIHDLAVHPDGSTIGTASQAGVIQFWQKP